jgi:hypothetical protein
LGGNRVLRLELNGILPTGYAPTPDAHITEISDEARFIIEEARRILGL